MRQAKTVGYWNSKCWDGDKWFCESFVLGQRLLLTWRFRLQLFSPAEVCAQPATDDLVEGYSIGTEIFNMFFFPSFKGAHFRSEDSENWNSKILSRSDFLLKKTAMTRQTVQGCLLVRHLAEEVKDFRGYMLRCDEVRTQHGQLVIWAPHRMAEAKAKIKAEIKAGFNMFLVTHLFLKCIWICYMSFFFPPWFEDWKRLVRGLGALGTAGKSPAVTTGSESGEVRVFQWLRVFWINLDQQLTLLYFIVTFRELTDWCQSPLLIPWFPTQKRCLFPQTVCHTEGFLR